MPNDPIANRSVLITGANRGIGQALVEEAHAAREAFLSSATTIVLPVVEIDGKALGDARPGARALALRRRFHDLAVRG